MPFVKYQHLERFGTEEVDDINLGLCHIFPKLDGTNASVWLEGSEVKAGSRNRELSLDDDNAGFYAFIINNKEINDFLMAYPHVRLYGEFLVPHSLKTYNKEAWRQFYVFDVCTVKEDGSLNYLVYDVYKKMLDEYNVPYVPAIAIIKDPNYEDLLKMLPRNTYLIEDGKGSGEGIVIKNYEFRNKYGRTTWAKLVTNEFKEKHAKEMGPSLIDAKKMIEEDIVEKYCTTAFIEKEYAKLMSDREFWNPKYIPELLGRVFSEFIKEETWNFVKEYKLPKVDFKTLNALVIRKIKETKSELF